MMRHLTHPTLWLWLLVAGTVMLLGGQALGMHWALTPNVAFGRLLIHPWVAAIEVLLAVLVIGLASLNRAKFKWMVNGFAVFAIGCALYHLFYYYIGTEYLLLYGAISILRENSKKLQDA